jgi:hypothetical protein
MKTRVLCAWLVSFGLTVTAAAAATGPVSQTFPAPLERVWMATERVLRQMGWDIDKADRTIGWMTTESRKVEGQGEDFVVYAKGARQRLTLNVKSDGGRKTTVSIERLVFRRERILWMDKDEPLTAPDQNVEKSVLAAIERSL